MRIVKLVNCIIVLLFICGNCLAQNSDTAFHKSKKTSIKPSTDFDQRFSFIKGENVNIWGQKFGAIINGKFKIGIGGYFLKDKYYGTEMYNDGTPYYFLKRNLTFATTYFEPFLIRRKFWEISIPFEIGIGKSYIKTFNNLTTEFSGSTTTLFFPTGTGISLSLKPPAFFGFKPFRWLGINFLAGYRYNLLERRYKTDYDGLFWSISGAIFIDKIVDDHREHKLKKKAKQKT